MAALEPVLLPLPPFRGAYTTPKARLQPPISLETVSVLNTLLRDSAQEQQQQQHTLPITRLTSMEDALVRDSEWQLICSYERLVRLCVAQNKDPATHIQRYINDKSDQQTADELRQGMEMSRRLDAYTQALKHYTITQLHSHDHLRLFEQVRNCYDVDTKELKQQVGVEAVGVVASRSSSSSNSSDMAVELTSETLSSASSSSSSSSPVAPATVTSSSALQRCYFSGCAEPTMYRMRFRCVDEQQLRMVEPAPVVVSGDYMYLLRAWYVLTHTREYIQLVGDAYAHAEQPTSTSHTESAAQTLQQAVQQALNDSARYLFLFFDVLQRQQEKEKHDEQQQLALSQSSLSFKPACVCAFMH